MDWKFLVKAVAEENDLVGLPDGVKHNFYKKEF